MIGTCCPSPVRLEYADVGVPVAFGATNDEPPPPPSARRCIEKSVPVLVRMPLGVGLEEVACLCDGEESTSSL